jgi:hypothetical protein
MPAQAKMILHLNKPDVVVHVCNSSYWEARVVGLQPEVSPRQSKELLSEK